MKCLNCGKASEELHAGVCKQCLRISDEMLAALQKGIVLEYKDGTKKVVKTKEKS